MRSRVASPFTRPERLAGVVLLAGVELRDTEQQAGFAGLREAGLGSGHG